jgi:hypothetical protein
VPSEAPTGPGQFDQLYAGLPRLPILHNNPAPDAQVSVPPRLIQSTSILRNAELFVSITIRFSAGRLQSRRQGVDVACNDGEAVARLIRLANGKSDDRAAIARYEVLAAGAYGTSPVIASRELYAKPSSAFPAPSWPPGMHTENRQTNLLVPRLRELLLEI